MATCVTQTTFEHYCPQKAQQLNCLLYHLNMASLASKLIQLSDQLSGFKLCRFKFFTFMREAPNLQGAQPSNR